MMLDDDAPRFVHEIDGGGRQRVHLVPQVLENTEVDCGHPMVQATIDLHGGRGRPEADTLRHSRLTDLVQVAQRIRAPELDLGNTRPRCRQGQRRFGNIRAEIASRTARNDDAARIHQRQTSHHRHFRDKGAQRPDRRVGVLQQAPAVGSRGDLQDPHHAIQRAGHVVLQHVGVDIDAFAQPAHGTFRHEIGGKGVNEPDEQSAEQGDNGEQQPQGSWRGTERGARRGMPVSHEPKPVSAHGVQPPPPACHHAARLSGSGSR